MKEYWEENLHALSRENLIKRLKKISEVFDKLKLPDKYEKEQLIFISDPDFNTLIIALSKEPYNTLSRLKSEYNKELVILYFYDPINEHKKFRKNIPEARINPIYEDPVEIKRQQIRWLLGSKDDAGDNGPHRIDERGLRILVKKGMIYLKELMDGMGLDYSKA